MGLARPTVTRTRLRLGVKGRPRELYMCGKANARRHRINETFFDTIKTIEAAYCLGLLYADGWIMKQDAVGLSSIDYELLVRLKRALATTVPISPCKRYSLQHSPSWSLVVCSRKLVRALIALGCVQRKSSILRFPAATLVPVKLRPAFVHGYWDGDGCVTGIARNISFNFVGTLHFLSGIAAELTTVGLPSIVPRPHGNVYRIEYHGRGSVYRFVTYLRASGTTGLKRKWRRLHAKNAAPIYALRGSPFGCCTPRCP